MNISKLGQIAGAITVLSLPLSLQAQSAPAVPTQPASVNYADIGTSVQIMGHFGLPIGKHLTLQGRRAEPVTGRKVENNNFQVQTVNGKAVAHPFHIEVDKASRLPLGTPCVVTGYEIGQMIGVPFDVQRHMTGPRPQMAGTKFEVRFVVLKVVVSPPIKTAEKSAKRSAKRSAV